MRQSFKNNSYVFTIFPSLDKPDPGGLVFGLPRPHPAPTSAAPLGLTFCCDVGV